VEVFGFNNSTRADDLTHQIQGACDHWHCITGASDKDVLELLRRLEIDVLVDLSGHTGANRLAVFASQAAPIQVTYLGYPDTTGLEAMNYRLTDPLTDPIGFSEGYHVEELYRLPNCFLCYKPDAEAPPVSPLPAIKNGFVTFGCFNNLSKVNDEVLASWRRLVAEAGGASRILVKNGSLNDVGTRKAFAQTMLSAGFEDEQFLLCPSQSDHYDHLASYQNVDIALDTFPYNGTTTTCEALWMGVPTVALKGGAHVSRVGYSLLNAAGLSGLVADSVDDYVAIAVELAGSVEKLARIRRDLRHQIRSSALMDSEGFTAGLERAYREMWARWCSASAV
jgi:predicted O-linked N-acetylglucosamine transferase (SPINDLY family)